MLPIVTMNISVVRDSRVLFSDNYTVAFGDGMIRLDLPQQVGCKWEHIAAFPSLETASCPTEQGSRLVDILALLGSDNFTEVLETTGYTVNEARRSVMVWVHAARSSLLVSNPQTTQAEDGMTPSSVSSKSCPRDHISSSLKAETKKLIIDIFPRDEAGCYLCKEAVDPALRRPKWVLDELFRALCENHGAQEAQKCIKFAVSYLRRQRRKHILIVSGRASEEELQAFNSEVSIWKDGPHGKAWNRGMKERPPMMMLENLANTKSTCENVFNR
jgi:hypothetical protein